MKVMKTKKDKETPIENSELLSCFTDQGISNEKAAELLKAAHEVVDRVTTWDKLAEIKVTSVDQKDEMKLAKKNRLSIKNDRLAVEKFVDSKRQTVQEQMASFKQEDTAWLRVKQFAEKKAKDHEEKLKEAEEFALRYENEQKEKLKAEQLEKLLTVTDKAENYPLPMDTDAFEALFTDLSEIKKQKKAQEEKEEEDRKKEELKTQTQNHRLTELFPYASFVGEADMTALWELSDEEYKTLLANAKKASEEKAENDLKQSDFVEKVNTRVSELTSLGLKFDFKTTYTGFGFFIDVLDIKTYEDDKWNELIEKVNEIYTVEKETQNTRLEKLISLGVSLTEATVLVPLGTSEDDYQELLNEYEQDPAEIPNLPQDEKGGNEPNPELTLESPEAPADGNYLMNWVGEFKIPPFLHEENLTEKENKIYQEIVLKFGNFLSWSKKQIEK